MVFPGMMGLLCLAADRGWTNVFIAGVSTSTVIIAVTERHAVSVFVGEFNAH